MLPFEKDVIPSEHREPRDLRTIFLYTFTMVPGFLDSASLGMT